MGKKKKVSRGMARRPGTKQPRKQKVSRSPFQMQVATAAPVSSGTILGSTVGLTMRSINDRELGPGVNITGSELFCNIGSGTTNTSNGILVPTSGVATGLDTMVLGPAASYLYNGASGVSSDLAVTGVSYQFHRFTSLRFRYVPSCPTSTIGNFTFAYSPDIRPSSNNLAGTTPAVVTTAQLGKLSCSVQTVPWQPCTLNVRSVPRSQSGFYCGTSQAITYIASASTTVTQGALVAPSIAESLHCFQGAFWGMSDVGTLGVGIALGKIILDYSGDFFYRGSLPAGSGGDQLSLSDHSFGLTNMTVRDHEAVEYLLSRKREQAAHPLLTTTLNNPDPRAALCDITWYNGTQVLSTGIPTNQASVGLTSPSAINDLHPSVDVTRIGGNGGVGIPLQVDMTQIGNQTLSITQPSIGGRLAVSSVSG
jgi:hypothetical protein